MAYGIRENKSFEEITADSINAIKDASGSVKTSNIADGAVTGTKLAAGAPNTAMAATRFKLVEGVHYGTSIPANIADDELFFLIEG